MKDGRISGYFDTKYMTVLRMAEQILHNFDDQKFANFFKLEQFNFPVTLVIIVYIKVVLGGCPRCPDNHDLSKCHRLYDLGRHI